MKKKLGKLTWLSIIILSLVGQIAWTMDNMFYNPYIKEHFFIKAFFIINHSKPAYFLFKYCCQPSLLILIPSKNSFAEQFLLSIKCAKASTVDTAFI